MAKRDRTAPDSAREPGGQTVPRIVEERLETQDEAARRLYRAGGKPERGAKTKRRVSEKPLKWREGRQ